MVRRAGWRERSRARSRAARGGGGSARERRARSSLSRARHEHSQERGATRASPIGQARNGRRSSRWRAPCCGRRRAVCRGRVWREESSRSRKRREASALPRARDADTAGPRSPAPRTRSASARPRAPNARCGARCKGAVARAEAMASKREPPHTWFLKTGARLSDVVASASQRSVERKDVCGECECEARRAVYVLVRSEWLCGSGS